MRTREEMLDCLKNRIHYSDAQTEQSSLTALANNSRYLVEVLLDIRDLLQAKK